MQLRKALKRGGFALVGEAKSGEQGLQLARKLEPDFILMDVNLEGMNGIDVTRAIVKERPVAIIMLTAYGDERTVERALDAGASYFLVKPVVSEQLVPAIKTAVARFDAYTSVRLENEGLKDQLETRKMVEQAKGILMDRMKLSEPMAFRRMQRISTDKCQTMKETAREIIAASRILS
jgi:response regulator NasT